MTTRDTSPSQHLCMCHPCGNRAELGLESWQRDSHRFHVAHEGSPRTGIQPLRNHKQLLFVLQSNVDPLPGLLMGQGTKPCICAWMSCHETSALCSRAGDGGFSFSSFLFIQTLNRNSRLKNWEGRGGELIHIAPCFLQNVSILQRF